MRRGRTSARIAIALLTGVLSLVLPPPAPAEHSQFELITTGIEPSPGSYPIGPLFSSRDGRRVLFSSVGRLAPEDTDRCEDEDPETGEITVFPCADGYERFNGVTSLLTTGPNDPQLNNPMELVAASKDGTRAFFYGGLEPPASGQTGQLYERSAGVNQPLGPVTLTNLSEDGRHAFFATSSRLVSEDTDDCVDYYERIDGTTRLVTTGVPPITEPYGPQCADLTRFGISADGTRFFAKTNATITSDDLDPGNGTSGSIGQDIYEWSAAGVRLITTGPADTPEDGLLIQNGAISRDGRRVFFSTTERLVSSDTDTEEDLYMRFDGETSLVAPAIAGDASPLITVAALSGDGSRVITGSWQRLAPADTDSQPDVYAITDRSARLLSIGPSGGNGDCPPSQLCSQFWASWVAPSESLPPSPMSAGGTGGASQDARVVLFQTGERLVPEDTDDARDLYANVDGVTRLVSTGTNDGPGHSFGADTFRGLFVSPDGSRVFFVTRDPLAVEDTDTALDVYEWHAGRTTVVPDGVPTPQDVILADHLPRSFVDDGSRVFIQTTTALTPDDLDTDHDLYGAALNGAPDCEGIAATPSVLRSASTRLVRIALSGVTDPDGDDVTFEITGVTQDEPVGRSRDAVLSSAGDEVRVRAERDNRGDGRVYRIEFEATDGNGGSCSGTAKVSVPRKKNKPAVDSAPPSYDSLG